MSKERKLTNIIFNFCDEDTYKCAFLNISKCLSNTSCLGEMCERYSYCAGNNLSHIDLYVEKLKLEKEQLQQELTNLKAIEKEHQRMNGELREENKELKHIIDELEEWLNDLGNWVVLEKLQELKGENNE